MLLERRCNMMDSSDLERASKMIDPSDYGDIFRYLRESISSPYILKKIEDIMDELENHKYALDFLVQARRHYHSEHTMFLEFLKQVVMEYHNEKAWYFLQQ